MSLTLLNTSLVALAVKYRLDNPVVALATIYHNSNQRLNIYGDDVEVDYRGYEVTAENFIRILTGRVKDGTPQVSPTLFLFRLIYQIKKDLFRLCPPPPPNHFQIMVLNKN